jgi:hypothetical protein
MDLQAGDSLCGDLEQIFNLIHIHPILNLLKPTGHVMHHQFNAHAVFICFVFI